MDPQQQQVKQLQDLFTNAKDILIITKERPSIDGISASLALYSLFSGQRTLQGKQKRVVVAVSGKQGSQYTLLPGADKIVSELGLRDLVIGVNGYVDNSIENVNWYVDKGRLNVVFKSNPAVPMQFDLKNLDPFYAGANFDVVVVLDAAAPTDLGNAYRQDPGMYSELPVVNISTSAQNTRFGRVNIVDPNVPSVSELAFQLAQIIRLPLTSDAASLFMVGMADATSNFSNKGAQTDAIVQQLQQHGARNIDLESVRKQSENPTVAPVQPAQPFAQGGPVPQYPMQGVPPVGQVPYSMPMYGQMPPQAGQMPGFVGYPPQQPYMPVQGYYPNVGPQGYSQPPMQLQYPPQYQPPVIVEQPAIDTQVQDVYPENSAFAQDGDFDAQGQEEYYTQTEEVPSIQHDLTQHGDYIPTSDISGFSHVEPSLYDPNIASASVYPSDFAQPDANDKLEEHKEQAKVPDLKAPDWKNPPKIFEGSRER